MVQYCLNEEEFIRFSVDKVKLIILRSYMFSNGFKGSDEHYSMINSTVLDTGLNVDCCIVTVYG